MVKMYGIANCDTIKKAKNHLNNQGIAFEFHDFKKLGLSIEQINSWLAKVPIDKLVNKRSTSWKQLSDEQKNALMEQTDLSVLTQMPTLIKRPVLETNQQTMVGYKAAEYDEIIAKL